MEEHNFSLVGYTGFVGSNIAKNGEFVGLYNTKNITNAYGTKPEVLVYAGLRAEKYIANKYPEKDMESIQQAIENIKRINPKKVVLISTIDVYNTFDGIDEKTNPDDNKLLPYGKNRLYLEKWIEEQFEEFCIMRLPGLFGQNIKKNFIYDFIHQIPFKLTTEKFLELKENNRVIEKYYTLSKDGFYTCKALTRDEEMELKIILKQNNFSALNFTDSRGIYQFYNLEYLWTHMNICLSHKVKKVNMATEPVSIDELYTYLTGQKFENRITENPPAYNFKTCYADLFEGKNGYIFDKEQVLLDIKKFVHSQKGEW